MQTPWNRHPSWKNTCNTHSSCVVHCALMLQLSSALNEGLSYCQSTIITEQLSSPCWSNCHCNIIQFILTMLWWPTPFHSPFQPSLSPFLNQKEMYFDNISSVNGFLLLKHLGPIALIETSENTPVFCFFFFNPIELSWDLGLGSALPRRTKSIFHPFVLLILKTFPLEKRTYIMILVYKGHN